MGLVPVGVVDGGPVNPSPAPAVLARVLAPVVPHLQGTHQAFVLANHLSQNGVLQGGCRKKYNEIKK